MNVLGALKCTVLDLNLLMANLRRLVKRILRKHGYPSDKQEQTTQTVLEQAEVLSDDCAT